MARPQTIQYRMIEVTLTLDADTVERLTYAAVDAGTSVQAMAERAVALGALDHDGLRRPPEFSPAPFPLSLRKLRQQTKTVAHIRRNVSFELAFVEARRLGADEFIWRGKAYPTKLAEETTPRGRALPVVEKLERTNET